MKPVFSLGSVLSAIRLPGVKPIIPIFFALALAASAATSATVENPEFAPPSEQSAAGEAIGLFRDGRHAEAIEKATKLAESGDADALFLLGFAAETGQGTPQSREGALDFYQRASQGGNKEATYRRALILLNSTDEKERNQGREALESAALEDPGVAGRILGEAWLRGTLGEEPDFDKTLEWWTRSANSGDNTSLLLLARLYGGDFGFPDKVDQDKSLDFYRKAAESGNANAYLPLGSRLLQRKEANLQKEGRTWIDKALDAGQTLAYLALGDYQENLLDDPDTAYGTYLSGARAGQPDCMIAVARLLYAGKGVRKDEKEGRKWLEKAAEAGSSTAHLELAGIIGADEEPDLNARYKHLVVAAYGNLPLAQNELGLVYMSDQLGQPDPIAAVPWFTRAARAGLPSAQFNLGTLYEGGVGVDRNLTNAVDLYLRAANSGHAQATSALARLHALGAGVDRNPAKAWALAKLAVDRGDEKAEPFIKELESNLDEAQLKEAQAEYARLKGQPVEEP